MRDRTVYAVVAADRPARSQRHQERQYAQGQRFRRRVRRFIRREYRSHAAWAAARARAAFDQGDRLRHQILVPLEQRLALTDPAGKGIVEVNRRRNGASAARVAGCPSVPRI